MAAIQNLVLTDRASTPVAHTFVPAGFEPNGYVVKVRENAANGVPYGANEFTLGLRQTPSGLYKATMKLVKNRVITETINGVAKITTLKPLIAECTFTYPEDCTKEERNNLVGMFADGMGTSKALVNDTIVELNKAY